MKVKNNEGLVVKAGGIILLEKDGKKYILLLYRGNHNDWSFPKGHAESGESITETMKREIKEEAGIDVEIIKELPENIYLSARNQEKIIAHMFLLKPNSEDVRKEHEGDRLEWVPIENVREMLTYDNLKDYFQSIKKYL